MAAGQPGKRLAVIPARGGSKRLPRKNIMDFAGKPMIAWTIEAALQSDSFAQVIVSTDDAEVAEVARRHGAAVPFMRQAYADDRSPVSLATCEAVGKLVGQGMEFTSVVQLLPVCPLRSAADIRQALAYFEGHDGAFQISCFDYAWSHPWWAHTVAPDGLATPLFPDVMKGMVRSQDLPKLYCPTGAIWIADVQALLREQTFYGPGYRMFALPWANAVDIDTQDDLEMALFLYAMMQQKDKQRG